MVCPKALSQLVLGPKVIPSIYLPCTSFNIKYLHASYQPIVSPRPSWYESFKKDPIQGTCWYENLVKYPISRPKVETKPTVEYTSLTPHHESNMTSSLDWVQCGIYYVLNSITSSVWLVHGCRFVDSIMI